MKKKKKAKPEAVKDPNALELPNLYAGYLGEKESKIIMDAEELLEKPIPLPNQTSVVLQYAAENLRCQKRIAHLASQLHIVTSRRWTKRCQMAASEIEDLKDEGYRAYGERAELVYRRSNIANAHDLYVRTNALAEYLDSLSWMLKNGMTVISKREYDV